MIDAAARVVAKHGFGGATVEAITSEAGLTSGALYSNFKTKEDLFLRLYEDKIQNRARDPRPAVDDLERVEDVIDAAVSDEASLLADREWLVLSIEFALYAVRTPTFARRFAKARKERLAERAQAVRQGLVKFHADPRTVDVDWLVRAGSGLTYGVALDNLIDRRKPAADDVSRGLRDLLLGELRRSRRDGR